MEAYVRGLSANNRQRLKTNSSKVLQRAGITIFRCTSETQLPRMLDGLFELHRQRWNERGEEGGFVHRPNLVRFYRRFAPVALKKGWLSFFALDENGELKAVQIGYVYNNAFHSMQEGFDPAYVKGVGNVLRARVIEACIAEGVHTYDFLGGMSDHKRSWRAKERTGHDLFLGHPSLKNRVLFARQVWPTGRYVRPVNPW
jgi:CelD/BcsL family acetyltransferase involved in cellulose biosynthesis